MAIVADNPPPSLTCPSVAKQESTYFAPRCLFCDHNNKRRHTRRGATWTCGSCGQLNPGPGMLKAIVGRFATPPADAKHTNGAPPPAATPKVAATTIKGVAKAPAAKPSPKPAVGGAVESKAQPTPSVPSTPPPAKRGGLLEGIAARVYG